MAETCEPQPPSDPGPPAPTPGDGQSGIARSAWAASIAFAAVLVGTALLGVLAGLLWPAVAPRALLVVVSRGSADVVNAETSAFIAADGWFTVLSLIGGVISGLLGYLFAVRRHGPVAMLSVLAGGLAAALIARWLGEQSGLAAFNHLLAVSRTGTLLHAPVTLGGVGALAFWPFAAGLTAGGIEAGGYLRDRRRFLDQQAGYPPSRRHGAATRPDPAGQPDLGRRQDDPAT
jgi:hypothetical protein